VVTDLLRITTAGAVIRALSYKDGLDTTNYTNGGQTQSLVRGVEAYAKGSSAMTAPASSCSAQCA